VGEGLGDEEVVAGDEVAVGESESKLGDSVELDKKLAEGDDEIGELGVGDGVVEFCSATDNKGGTDEIATLEDATGVDELGNGSIESGSRMDDDRRAEVLGDSGPGEGDSVGELDSRPEDEEATDELGSSLGDKDVVEESSSILEEGESGDEVDSRGEDGEGVDKFDSTFADEDGSDGL
jgi:hypothetical protein